MAPYPDLMGLPVEILCDLLVHLSEIDHASLFNVSHVNKTLQAIAEPLLVRRYDYHYWKPLEFANYLLQHPSGRRYVEDISMSNISPDYIDSHLRLVTEPRKLNAIEQARFAEAVPEDWADLGSRLEVDWKSQFQREIPDAFYALILLWAVNLKRLELKVPNFSTTGDDGDPYACSCVTMLLFTRAVHRILESKQAPQISPLPLSKLQVMVYCHWDTEDTTEAQFAAPFFWLPNLRTFHGIMLGWSASHEEEEEWETLSTDEDYMTTFPKRESGIQELILENVDLAMEGYQTIVGACRQLKSLHISLNPILNNAELNSHDFARVILQHADSLERLFFFDDDSESREWLTSEGGGIAFDECFPHLHSLKYLEISLSHLENKDNGRAAIPLYENLPSSIQHLVLHLGSYFCIRPGIDDDVISLRFTTIRELVLHSGPSTVLPNMKVLDLTDALIDDCFRSKAEELQKVAADRGIEVLLNL